MVEREHIGFSESGFSRQVSATYWETLSKVNDFFEPQEPHHQMGKIVPLVHEMQ